MALHFAIIMGLTLIALQKQLVNVGTHTRAQVVGAVEVQVSVVPPNTLKERAKAKVQRKVSVPATVPASVSTPAQTHRKVESGDATAMGSKATKEAGSEYSATILQKIRDVLEYPLVLRAKQIEGTTLVRFVFDSNGTLVSAAIKTSSGYPELDSLALRAIRQAQPYPLPSNERDRLVELSLPIQFKLVKDY